MKKVVAKSMVAHLWANQSQSEARNATGSMYFRDSTIYSYGSHFPMARHVGSNVLLTTKRYSSTTNRHLSEVRHAIRHLTVIECVNVLANSPQEHTDNLLAIRKQCYEYLDKATRSRTQTAWLLNAAGDQYQQHERYRTAFGMELDSQLVIEADWKAATKGRIEAQKELAKEHAKQKALAEFRRKLEAIADLEKWKTGEIIYRSGFANYGLPIVLRARYGEHVTGQSLPETIETSAGASVPARDARRIWKLILKIRSNGVPYQRNGHTEHVGHFSVDSIAVDGTLVVGCHTITFEVMQELAGKLGWQL